MTKLYDITDWPKLGIDETCYPFIGSVDTAPAIGRILDIEGQRFGVGVLSIKKGTAGVRKMHTELNISSKESVVEDDIVCPYCGNVYRDSFELCDEDTIECQRCGGTIHYERIVTIEYETEPVKPPKVIRARWIKDA